MVKKSEIPRPRQAKRGGRFSICPLSKRGLGGFWEIISKVFDIPGEFIIMVKKSEIPRPRQARGRRPKRFVYNS